LTSVRSDNKLRDETKPSTMKKLFILTLATCLFSFSSFAQIEVGLKAGVNFTNLPYSADLDYGSVTPEDVEGGIGALKDASWRPGFHFGAYALMDVGALSLQPELLFSQKGMSEFNVDGDDFVLNYFSIPVMVGFQPFDMLHLQLGPEFSFLMSGKIKQENDDFEPNDYFAKSDLGAALGASIDWPGPGLLTLRYVHGLSGVLESDQQYGTEDYNLRNRAMQVSLAFPLFNTANKSDNL